MASNGPLDRLQYHVSGAIARGEATPITERTLSDLMEFDHPITVHANGAVTDGPAGVYAPDLTDGELSGDEWEFFSYGYTGQDSYRGPIMHNSEYIGGRLARDILATPGVYCAVVAYWFPEDGGDGDDNGELQSEGWAIVRRTD